MNSRKFAAACVGAALSLAVASFGASAADYTPMKPLQPPPAPPPPLDIHGFFDVTFANDYMTPRGLLVTNTGLTTQIVNGLTFGLYKDPNTWINSFSITAGTFNDMWSQQNNVTVGSWNVLEDRRHLHHLPQSARELPAGAQRRTIYPLRRRRADRLGVHDQRLRQAVLRDLRQLDRRRRQPGQHV